MEALLTGLRAAAEPTRLRLIALCAEVELTVTELTQILGQSQPRVSRHLKLLCEAGLLDRSREGTWAYYRLARRGVAGELAANLLELLPTGDPALQRDRDRLAAIRATRRAAAETYFSEHAADWDRIRSLHIDEKQVEAALLEAAGPASVDDMLDIGTGTGRLLELFADRAHRLVGVDLSREMLAVARAALDKAGHRNCAVRQADLYQLPFDTASFDLIAMHQVLHYLDDPAVAIGEAARVLRPGGRLVIADFAPHTRADLAAEQAHRRLGFTDAEVVGWLSGTGLTPGAVRHLPSADLTVTIWTAIRPAISAQAGDAVALRAATAAQ